jgi:hypothetical protein
VRNRLIRWKHVFWRSRSHHWGHFKLILPKLGKTWSSHSPIVGPIPRRRRIINISQSKWRLSSVKYVSNVNMSIIYFLMSIIVLGLILYLPCQITWFIWMRKTNSSQMLTLQHLQLHVMVPYSFGTKALLSKPIRSLSTTRLLVPTWNLATILSFLLIHKLEQSTILQHHPNFYCSVNTHDAFNLLVGPLLIVFTIITFKFFDLFRMSRLSRTAVYWSIILKLTCRWHAAVRKFPLLLSLKVPSCVRSGDLPPLDDREVHCIHPSSVLYGTQSHS